MGLQARRSGSILADHGAVTASGHRRGKEEAVLRQRPFLGLLVAVAALALVATGCGSKKKSEGGGNKGGNAKALPASSCQAIYYEGEGQPDYIVASDLPLQGSSRTQTIEMTKAIKFALKQHNFKAGKYNIGYQSCDDSTAQAGKWASQKCSANGNAYAQNKSVIGVVGTFNSGCAEIIIPILNRAPDGPVGMVSPANTYVGLTHGGPGTASGEPDKYYPNGTRNYIRIVAADDYQGASNALLAQQLGYKSVFIFNDKEAYGLGVATDFRNAAKKLGLNIAGFTAWDPKASSYEALANRVQQSGADVVYLGGLECENGSKLIKDLRGKLGKDFPLIAPDGFSSFTDTFKNSGGAAVGMYISVAGLPNEKLGPAGKKFVQDFGAEIGGTVNPYSAYGAQAMEVMLTAIQNSDGTRAAVAGNLLKTKVKDGILGTFSINENGDTTSNPVTQYKLLAGGKTTAFKTITPPASLVKVS
jgi:branched-chain amino acid transport system substrate-binding protein